MTKCLTGYGSAVKACLALFFLFIAAHPAHSADRGIDMLVNPDPVIIGNTARFVCNGTGEWKDGLRSATITIYNSYGTKVVDSQSMTRNRYQATFDYTISDSQNSGGWEFRCYLRDNERNSLSKNATFQVVDAVSSGDTTTGGGSDSGTGTGSGSGTATTGHESITSYNGPSTCIACHQEAAQQMLNSLHMKWAGPTPDLTNSTGEELGKGNKGINTFCTYAPSSKGACYGCHVRADGNSPNPPSLEDVDCLMCHNDTYQRKFVTDPNTARTVTNVNGETKTYVFGLELPNGDMVTEPDFAAMPAGTTMVDLARNVHLPTRASCLRCHAKAGGGDWTKRGDMGLSTKAPTLAEDVHMSAEPGGANLSCTACHATGSHKIGGRGIDLRQTEAANPECTTCHTAAPHSNTTLNRHAQGQVSCQVCHIREFGKGGATEMSRDWRIPTWNPGFCSGQGGFVGDEVKESNVKPEYTWFDGTSYVYNLGESIQPGADGIYHMAVANGKAFDGKSKIVPIKRHKTVMPLHESGQIIPPVIMEMFMTGDFDQAVQAGMAEQGMTGNYQIIDADAEMLITHGVEPKEMAPSCTECHNMSGTTANGMVPFDKLGYRVMPAKVKSCTLCHERKSSSWQSIHDRHAKDEDNRSNLVSCNGCHTPEPSGLVKPTSDLCNDCHSQKSASDVQKVHKTHIEKGYTCTKCHKFN